MTNKELLEKLNSQLKEINELLSLGDLGLLKSDELYATKHRIEDELNSFRPFFEKIEALKIEKAIPKWRNVPKSGIFVQVSESNNQLSGLHILIQELINSKGGSEQIEPVKPPELKITGSTINQAVNDAKILITTQGATSAVDRVHTVLHGYLKKVCDEEKISYPADPTLNQLLKEIKAHHKAFDIKNENIDQVLKSMANIFDKLNPIRNSSSIAHPNSDLLDQDEAMLIINTVNTILAYLDAKFSK